MLERMLRDKGALPPPSSHPPRIKHDGQHKDDEEQQPTQVAPPPCEIPSPPDTANEYSKTDFKANRPNARREPGNSRAPQGGLFLPHVRSQAGGRRDRLLSTSGKLSFDQLSGRLRFFGPTANSHVYAESKNQFDSREPPGQVRRAERIIRSLSSTTYEYLMCHFWQSYNSIIPSIYREAFEAGRDSQTPNFYSSFLHFAILAMGYRGCDMERDDMKRISLGDRESTLHREAKYMLDIELERPGMIPSVQALLLLRDLECGVGRDNTGWMDAGKLAITQTSSPDSCNLLRLTKRILM